MSRRLRAEDGSILPLVFGFFAIALALVLVVTAATSLYLERSRLYTLADGAALAGADSVVLDAAAGAGEGAGLLGDAAVAAAAADYLDAATAGRRTPVGIALADSPDGRSARVRLAEDWRPPLLSVFVPSGVHLEVEGRARPVFW
ncbi:MAG: hypothetical protein FWD85_02740 [Microbacteriaceae bacterium]|nr:hypothetical protein [Microbacteriaceae bacterium]MCL2794208.1 hypothetical protein [Microbacteriaceae bacterium]